MRSIFLFVFYCLFYSIPNEFLSIKRIKDSTEGILRADVCTNPYIARGVSHTYEIEGVSPKQLFAVWVSISPKRAVVTTVSSEVGFEIIASTVAETSCISTDTKAPIVAFCLF